MQSAMPWPAAQHNRGGLVVPRELVNEGSGEDPSLIRSGLDRHMVAVYAVLHIFCHVPERLGGLVFGGRRQTTIDR